MTGDREYARWLHEKGLKVPLPRKLSLPLIDEDVDLLVQYAVFGRSEGRENLGFALALKGLKEVREIVEPALGGRTLEEYSTLLEIGTEIQRVALKNLREEVNG